MRSALHTAGASYAGIRLSQDAADAAKENLNLVVDAYSVGAVSIIDLIDAQNAALIAAEVAANASYDFLLDLAEVERALGIVYTLMNREAQDAIFEQLAQYMSTHENDR
jgi:outer membrane protein TolC